MLPFFLDGTIAVNLEIPPVFPDRIIRRFNIFGVVMGRRHNQP
jgi:hypothetical protein